MTAEGTYAVVKTGGKQYRVSPGTKVTVEKLTGDVGSVIELAPVLMTSDGSNTKIGTPILTGASVKAKIVAHEKGEKVVIYKKRRRKGYTKKQGHRQLQTIVVVESINS